MSVTDVGLFQFHLGKIVPPSRDLHSLSQSVEFSPHRSADSACSLSVLQQTFSNRGSSTDESNPMGVLLLTHY